MQLVVVCSIGYEASSLKISLNSHHHLPPKVMYLSSEPPSFLTMFLKENTVPKTSFASSSALRVLDCD